MAIPSHGRASFSTQANALLRKNLVFQRRNKRSNCCLIIFPVLLCVLLSTLQRVIDNELNKEKYRCGCAQVNGTTECGIQYSTLEQASSCPIPTPQKWPALLQVPDPQNRAVRTDFLTSSDLPSQSCRQTGSCPVTVLVTGSNRTLGQSLASNLFPVSPVNSSDFLFSLANNVLGSASMPETQNFLDPAYTSGLPLYFVQPRCQSRSSFSLPVEILSSTLQQDVTCAQGLHLWRNSSSDINDDLYKGYRKGNPEREINEFVAAYDFLNSNMNNFNVSLWYNATFKNDTGFSRSALIRVPRSVNLVSNAYLQFLLGPSTRMLLEFVKEMPKPGTRLSIDISSLLSAQFFTFVIVALFPVVLTALVYEKQQRLRIMMKMHGLGDGPYWTISYAYFLALSAIYMICFVVFGSLIGLKIFTTNDYSIQFVFYFLYINLQISMAFLVAPIFTNVLSARAVGYLLTFGTGLLGGFLFQNFVQDTSFPRGWIIAMELYPGFSLYRGLYELGQYSFLGDSMGTHGMRWENLGDGMNGMKEIMIIMFVEWLIVLPIAFYVDQVVSSGSGVKRNPLFFFQSLLRKSKSVSRKHSLQKQGSKIFVEMEKADVVQERERVEQLLSEPSSNTSIVCNNLRKIYPGRDGNPPKLAVKGLSLAVPRGECFGMLGPNGAGKTSFISMMIGLTDPTSGAAFVEGSDIRFQMNEIYTSMGVCPQHDLLWETLTGREHLIFYGRLKNLKGSALMQAVEESLKSVNLYHGGVADKLSGKYSGGMKRRLSVAISLIGDPKVVYMDEPSTGLDPASRNNLWNVVKQAKQDRAIILTTHSMEEAEVLCDRIGIFVDGNLQCIGGPKQLKGRYGGSFVFTMTTSAEHDAEVETMVRGLSPNAQKIYHISGTQKFEIPKHEIQISDVFKAVEKFKKRFSVQAWGLADTTLEDVFIKVAREAQSSDILS
ncbi:ABC transporter A family member 7 [Beta vulgaris subsp. vulgaris]|uniref:ABC transporter A family member 7 n=1 Tax=Beta vulgaris subsp. vulgaris TaxID=3555 RepID=UPI002036CD7B|nr:ABC transporter A family member 7 [Beta vulgaris subsp. vulgaris]